MYRIFIYSYIVKGNLSGYYFLKGCKKYYFCITILKRNQRSYNNLYDDIQKK